VPSGPSWTVRIAKFGFAVTTEAIVSSSGATTNASVQLGPGFADDFEVDQAWGVGAPGDDATAGLWVRAVPVASSYLGPVGPGEDASAGGAGFAYVTGQHVAGSFAGTSDVDGGHTTLLSPVFDGTGLGSIQLEYQRWFSNRAPTPDQDEFRADVSTDGGSTWHNLETIDVGTDAWALVSIDLSAVVTPTASMRLRFVAEDVNAETFVEAGIDDVRFVTAATDAPASLASAPRLELSNAVPNPFRHETALSFQLPTSGPVELSIYDVTGRRDATLLSASRLAAGAHRVSWDGRGEGGAMVTPGVYFAKLRVDGTEASRKLIRLN
jgi:hypothetical protein